MIHSHVKCSRCNLQGCSAKFPKPPACHTFDPDFSHNLLRQILGKFCDKWIGKILQNIPPLIRHFKARATCGRSDFKRFLCENLFYDCFMTFICRNQPNSSNMTLQMGKCSVLDPIADSASKIFQCINLYLLIGNDIKFVGIKSSI